jgi:hypothetical protein
MGRRLEVLRYAIRYNPWPRLVINALKRLGITLLPYYVFTRSLAETRLLARGRTGGQLVELREADMATIAAMPMANSSEKTYRTRLALGHRCFGLMHAGELVCYCWLTLADCRVNGAWLRLRSGEAYIYDVYTLPQQRGRNFAPLLNARFSEWLPAAGVTHIRSVVDYYNRPSLRYVAKIGGRRLQLRLYLRLAGLLERSILLKSYPATHPQIMPGDPGAGAHPPVR